MSVASLHYFFWLIGLKFLLTKNFRLDVANKFGLVWVHLSHRLKEIQRLLLYLDTKVWYLVDAITYGVLLWIFVKKGGL